MSPGDPLLDELRDIHLPPPPEFWPPAPGWWLATLAALVVLGVLGLFIDRALRRRARRKRILARLEALPGRYDQDPARLAAEVSLLLRRVALAHYPRTAVAGLTGPAWREFLDRHMAGPEPGRRARKRPPSRAFRDGPGRVLDDAPYAPRPSLDRTALLDLARTWIRSHT